MTNNDILRRIRYIFDFSDAKMVSLFKLGGSELTNQELLLYLEKDESGASHLLDKQLAGFLNGLIVNLRGERDGGPPEAEERLSNNIILRKLKIALAMQDTDIIDILGLASLRVSKHEINAFFRKKGHKNFRKCKDQVLRNFLLGLQYKYRKDRKAVDDFVWK